MSVKDIFLRFYRMYLSKRWKLSWYMSGELMNDFLYDYKAGKLPAREIFRIHQKGFAAYDWCYCGITHETCHNYLSNAEYNRHHPYNGEYSKWIDDKLTLKHLCSGTALDKYMPEYYYHIDENGKVLCLPDCLQKKKQASVADIADLLECKGSLAIKLLEGSVGEGFYKGEYSQGKYLLNAQEHTREAFCDKLSGLRGYLITEYFYPHPEFARYSTNSPGCIRYAACRVGEELKMLASFVRFGTKASGFVENYGTDGALCLVCSVDEHGYYRHGTMLDPANYQKVFLDKHPDTGVALAGKIPHWQEILDAADLFGAQFPQLNYMGFDFVVTADDRVKIMEINSMSSLDCLQEARSVFESPAGDFFRSLQK